MLTYELDKRGQASRYEYLYRCIRDDIERGGIAACEKLPSKRALARHLGVSLATVESAYSQLVAEGYVESFERKGYFASDLGAPFAARGPHAVGQGSPGFPPRPAGDAPEGFSAAPPATAAPDVSAAPLDCADADVSRETSASFPMPDGCAAGEGVVARSFAPSPSPGSCAHPERSAQAEASVEEAPLIADFTGGAGPPGAFPYRMWARTVRTVLAEESERSLAAAAADAAGSRRLREAIASYLLGFRGMRVSPDQIVIGAGAQTLYHTIVQLVGRSRRLALEDPGYPRLTGVYRANDVDVAHVPLDERGVSVEALRASGADVLHCMPSHQFPTGLVTPVSRRYELLGWASERAGRYLVEDDYDCEFRLAGRPIPTLQSIDAAERVIYVNTFTKSLGAAFRIGYLVLPPHLAEAFRSRLGFYAGTVGAIDQLALARFIEQGGYERHVNRSRSRCRAVRASLVASLRRSPIADRLIVEEADAGLHFVLGIGTDAHDADLVSAARAEGLALSPLATYCVTAPAVEACRHRFVMSDASLDPADVDRATAALVRAVEAAEFSASSAAR